MSENMWWMLLSGLSLANLLTYQPMPERGALLLQIENVSEVKGSLRIAVYDRSEVFMNEAESRWGEVVRILRSGACEITVPDLPFGQYAVVVHHDLNDNRKLDKNLLGIPSEPYAFSNDPDVKWRPPHFEEVSFAFVENGQHQRLYLRRWGER